MKRILTVAVLSISLLLAGGEVGFGQPIQNPAAASDNRGFARPVPAPISEHVGKYPFNKVKGLTFVQNPVVIRAIETALWGSVIQNRVLDSNGVSSPIERRGDFIVMQVCEPHNCYNHNWAVFLTRSGGHAAVCYFNSDLSDGSRWFVAGRLRLVISKQRCNSARLPDSIALALVN